MYAVVEFSNKKEFSIVPLIWLSDDKTWCYWQLKTLIESLSPAKETWTKYSIRRLHKTAETYSDAETTLQIVLAESSSSPTTDHGRDQRVITLRDQVIEKNDQIPINGSDLSSSDDEINPNSFVQRDKKNILRSLQKITEIDDLIRDLSDLENKHETPREKPSIISKRKQAVVNFSSDSENEDLETFQKNKKKTSYGTPKLKHNHSQAVLRTPSFTQSNNLSPSYANMRRHLIANQNGDSSNNSSVSASLYMENSEWGRMVTRDLARIKEVQDQNSSLLAQIWQTLQVQNIKALERPSDVPNFPIERKRDFGNLENWLENEQNFCYMRTRLSSNGGNTVRNAVMNMLKYGLSNKVGMGFNWAGTAPKLPNQSRKHAFKDTKMYKALNEAAKITFQSKGLGSELTDKVTGLACQDWLKLSKQRYENSKKTNE